MKIVTVKLPEAYLEGIDMLVDAGIYTSRSEAIRVAIRDLLKKEVWGENEKIPFLKKLKLKKRGR